MTGCQYLGAILGLLGAVLVSSRLSHRRRVGFACWIVSNIALIVVFVAAALWPLVAMQSVYLVTAFVGWVNNRP